MRQLSVRLFGYPQFLIDNASVKVERRKSLAVAVYLAVETAQNTALYEGGDPSKDPFGQPVLKGCGRDTLATLFWPDQPAEKASAYLRQAIWDFSKAAGDEWLIKDNQTIAINPAGSVWVDVRAFRDLYARQNPGLHHQAAPTATLIQLAELYRDDFLSGFTLPDSPGFDDWQALQTETLRLQLTIVLEELVDRLSAQHQFEQGIQYALRWLSLDPLNETCHRALMVLYEDNNQRSSALQQYELCAGQLKKELGIEPSNETVSLYHRIRNQRATPAAVGIKKPVSGPPGKAGTHPARPTGTVTFLFSDFEGSTQLWEHHPLAMQKAFSRQESIMRKAMADHGGYVYKMIGDAFQVAFSTAPSALQAALAAQRALEAEPWGEVGALKVRMALHTGITEEREDDYVGPTLNRVARILSAGYGGQILINQPAFEQLRERLPERISITDFGERQLKDLVSPEHIYQVTTAGLPGDFPPLKTMDIPVKHLPPQSTPFLGRDQELAEIEQRLSAPDCRLLTLAGIGGSGKTRLAIQAASQTRVFQGDVYFVALDKINNAQGLVATIADALNLAEKYQAGAAYDSLKTQAILQKYLAAKEVLLVLDNFEQLTGCAEVLSDLLLAAHALKLIISSRERLNLPGEWVLDVLGLSFPGAEERKNIASYPAAHLFLRSAERACGFIPQAADWPAIARICQLLEGIPLGIEMAASWVKLLSCQDIADEVGKSLDFLTSNWRGMPERHRTIRAVFDYSWQLLNDQEKKVFSGLSLFVGGFNREAVMAVTGVPLQVLSALVDKSLVRRQSAGRYEIHPLLNQYAAEKLSSDLDQSVQFQQRYSDYYCDWLARMEIKLKGRSQLEALNQLRYDSRNLTAVWLRLIETRNYPRLKQVLPAYIAFYEMQNRFNESLEAANGLTEIVNLLAPVCGEQEYDWPFAPFGDLLALSMAAVKHFKLPILGGDELADYQRKSLKIALALPDSVLKALCLVLNTTGYNTLGIDESIAILKQCCAISQRQGDQMGVALATLVMGDNYNYRSNDLGNALTSYQSSLDLFKELGNTWGEGKCLFGLTDVKRKEGKLAEAYQFGLQSMTNFEKLNTVDSYFRILYNLAEIAECLGQYKNASSHYQNLLDYFRQNGDLISQQPYFGRITWLEERIKQLDSAIPAGS